MAAVFAVSTAWAGAQPAVRTALAQWEAVILPRTPPPAPPKRTARVPPPPASAPAPALVDPSDEAVSLVPVEALPVAAGPGESNRPSTHEEGRAPSAAASAAASGHAEALRLYSVAHRLHFVDRDPEGALRAWDAYLDAAPTGALAPEARYNRAICLLRLGRNGEARRTLQPFADGVYGEYRAREARDLLAASAR